MIGFIMSLDKDLLHVFLLFIFLLLNAINLQVILHGSQYYYIGLRVIQRTWKIQ